MSRAVRKGARWIPRRERRPGQAGQVATATITGIGEFERRQLLTSVVRAALSTALLLTAYYLFPLQLHHDPRHGVGYGIFTLARLGVAVAVFIAVLSLEIRAISRSAHPILRAGVAMAVVIPLFLIFFAWTYLTMSAADPGAFSQHLDRTQALYFTVTVFSTVGFGDIVPRTDTARIVAMVQMLADLGVVAVVVRLIFGAAKEVKAEASAVAGPDGAGGASLS
jgi:hypothetical protein